MGAFLTVRLPAFRTIKMWHAVQTSGSIAAFAESNWHAVLAITKTASVAYFQVLTLAANQCRTGLASLCSTAILTKHFPAVFAEAFLALSTNVCCTFIASALLQSPVRTVFGLIHPRRGLENLAAFHTRASAAV